MQGISIQTESRVALVRHARSAHVHTGWIDATGFRAWQEAYTLVSQTHRREQVVGEPEAEAVGLDTAGAPV